MENNKYEIVIGLEIHIQLKTESKMFCACSNKGEDLPTNTTICPICMGHPGTLPFINNKAIEFGLKTALALNCTINNYSKFDRKNYFYPDLPKGYQISQYDQPVGVNGYLNLFSPNSDGTLNEFQVQIRRLHLEEDAAKLIHSNDKKSSLVDYNRAGTPLMEIVTEPVITSPLNAKIFLQNLRLIARYLDVSSADMEKGHLRCDANISIKFNHNDQKIWTPISEIKNLNSFKAVEKALTYEAERQYNEWLAGGDIINQKGKVTLGWDEKNEKTIIQRSKEEAHDYRYFPEPDLPPLVFEVDYIEKMRSKLPELPTQKIIRLMDEYTISISEAMILVEDKDIINYFEMACSELNEWLSSTGLNVEQNQTKGYKLLSGWLINKLYALLNEDNQKIVDCKISAENFAEFICIILENKINSTSAQIVLQEMYQSGAEPDHIIKEKGLEQISNSTEIEKACDQIIEQNTKPVKDYKAGKTNIIMFLVGQVMKATGGKAKPELVKEILEQKLK